MASYDISSLNLGNITSERELLQALILLVAKLEKEVSGITSELVGNSLDKTIASFVSNALNDQLKSSTNSIKRQNTGENALYTIFGQVPGKCAVWYWGDLGLFDNTGKGRPGTEVEGWCQMNGLNGTLDMRGYTPVGATNVQGGPVDPSLEGFEIRMGEKKGSARETLTVEQLPQIKPTITDPGHTHGDENVQPVSVVTKNGDTLIYGIASPRHSSIDTTKGTVKKTGITVSSFGQNQSHNNVQPSIGGCWITRLS